MYLFGVVITEFSLAAQNGFLFDTLLWHHSWDMMVVYTHFPCVQYVVNKGTYLKKADSTNRPISNYRTMVASVYISSKSSICSIKLYS